MKRVIFQRKTFRSQETEVTTQIFSDGLKRQKIERDWGEFTSADRALSRLRERELSEVKVVDRVDVNGPTGGVAGPVARTTAGTRSDAIPGSSYRSAGPSRRDKSRPLPGCQHQVIPRTCSFCWKFLASVLRRKCHLQGIYPPSFVCQQWIRSCCSGLSDYLMEDFTKNVLHTPDEGNVYRNIKYRMFQWVDKLHKFTIGEL